MSRDQLAGRKKCHWLIGDDVSSRVLYVTLNRQLYSIPTGRSAGAFKAEKPGPVRSEDERPGRAGLKSVLLPQPDVHSNQCSGHPLPLLPTHMPGPQGWD